MTTLLSLAFFFVILDHHNEGFDNWREAPANERGYATYQECVDGQTRYRMNDEAGVFSECYGKVVSKHGK